MAMVVTSVGLLLPVILTFLDFSIAAPGAFGKIEI